MRMKSTPADGNEIYLDVPALEARTAEDTVYLQQIKEESHTSSFVSFRSDEELDAGLAYSGGNEFSVSQTIESAVSATAFKHRSQFRIKRPGEKE